MRTKDEILERCRDDIQKPKYNPQTPLWLEYRKIEILIDIRDIIKEGFEDIDTAINNISLIR